MSRYSYSDRDIVEETPRVTIQAIIKSYVLNENHSVFISSFNYQLDGFWITAYDNGNNSYSLQIQYDYMGREIETNCDITSIPCNFGGVRYYLECPMTQKK